jgi:hypothetical protein
MAFVPHDFVPELIGHTACRWQAILPSLAPIESHGIFIGDFFIHYLDSPEQALLVIPIFSQIKPGGGGTFIATDGIGAIARRLLAVPQGIRPGLHNADDSFNFSDRLAECKDFVELTGDIGDVILMHPLMVSFCFKRMLLYLRDDSNAFL